MHIYIYISEETSVEFTKEPPEYYLYEAGVSEGPLQLDCETNLGQVCRAGFLLFVLKEYFCNCISIIRVKSLRFIMTASGREYIFKSRPLKT